MLSRAPKPFDQIFDMQSAGPNIKKFYKKALQKLRMDKNFNQKACMLSGKP